MDIRVETTTTLRDGYNRTAIMIVPNASFDLVDAAGTLLATINTYGTQGMGGTCREIGIDVIPNGFHVRARAWKQGKVALDFEHPHNGLIGITFEGK